VCGLGWAGSTTLPGRPATPPPRPVSAAPRPVQVERAALRPLERITPATGWLAARERATLSTKVAGRLKSLTVDLGSQVAPGDLLAQIEPRDFELRVQQATAALAQARAALGLPLEGESDTPDLDQVPEVRQARAVADEASRNVDRLTRLHREGITPHAELDTAESQLAVAREKLQTAQIDARTRQATLAQRRAELDLARQQLADTAIRAPFPGVVQERLAHLGEYLTAGAPVLELVQLDPLRLRLQIPEREAALIQPGLTVRARVDGQPNTHEGRIARVAPALDPDDRMLTIEADIPHRAGLRPGLFVRADLVIRADDPGLVIPSKALTTFAGIQKAVLLVQGAAVERVVTTGRRGEDWVEVLSGLSAGDTVVVNPAGIRTGQAIEAAPAVSAGR